MNPFFNPYQHRYSNGYYNTPYYHHYNNNVYSSGFQVIQNEKNDAEENNEKNTTTIENNQSCEQDKEGINIFGIHLELDDIILGAIIIFLCLESKRDYILIILLGLILFDSSLDSLLNKIKDLEFLKNFKI